MKFVWSRKLAYGVGLIVSDGSLSNDGRHLVFVSKDKQQIDNFCLSLGINPKVELKKGAYTGKEDYYCIQFSDVKLYRFLLKIGVTPNKSKTIGAILVPNRFFSDFLRGLFDGDGFSYSYWDPRWSNSYLFYVGFVSASLHFILWLQDIVFRLCGVKGSIKKAGKSAFQLIFNKTDSVRLASIMYKGKDLLYLERKKYKIDKSLGIIATRAGMLKLVDKHA